MFHFLKQPKRLIDIINFIEITNKRFINVLRPSSFFVNYSSENRLCCPVKSSVGRTNPSWLVLSRNKYVGKGKRRANVEDEESSDEEEDDDYGEDDNVKTYRLAAARCDVILKSILRISRKTVEEHFYQNKIRVNGIRLLKKSQNVSVGDEVDVIKHFSSASDSLTIDRIKIVDIKSDKEADKILVKAIRYKSITVKNYSSVNAYREIEEE